MKTIEGKEMDLSKLKAGDKVIVEFEIERISECNTLMFKNGIALSENKFRDIKEIIPKAFDWKDVKWGMGFKCGKTWYTYIGRSTFCEGNVILNVQDLCVSFSKNDLTRCPEHDLQGVK